MTKSLIIAEKPSVAQDIVRALTPESGKFEKHAEYFENEHYVVTSAVGHLVEIAAPEEYDVKRGKWSFAHLPVVPPHFDLAPIDKTKTRLNAVVKLLKRKDVSNVVNACDAGREGELIFRLIQQYAKAKQPVKRLWLQSMTPQAIRDGFSQLRGDSEMQGLADAARSRSEADWLVGINGTRAMTAFNSRDGGFFLTTVGRVQTPTLSIVVEREEKIRKHVARDYWEVKGVFGATAGAPHAGRATVGGAPPRLQCPATRQPEFPVKSQLRALIEQGIDALAALDARLAEGDVVGELREDAELDAQRFERTAQGVCLITAEMLARL